MRRPYLIYLLAVVVPSAVTVALGVLLVGASWTAVHHGSQARAARMALAAFQQDLGRTVDSLVRDATPDSVAHPADALAARALAGDTASGFVPGLRGIEVQVARPAEAGDPPNTVRRASAPLPTSAQVVGRAAGYRTALYLGGRRSAASEPPPGPETLDRPTLLALRQAPAGVAVTDGDADGVLVALTDQPGTAGSIAVLSASPAPPANPLPIPLLLVMGLLLLFACLAGWIQLSGEERRETRFSLVLLGLVPALTAWGFLVHSDRLFRDAVDAADRRDLTRALAVARVRDEAADPLAIHALSGFHAYQVRDGAVVKASLDGPTDALARLSAPPPSFTSTGVVRTPEGRTTYVALRLPDGGFAVVTAVGSPLHDAYGRKARWLALVLAGWLAVVGAAVTWWGRRVSG